MKNGIGQFSIGSLALVLAALMPATPSVLAADRDAPSYSHYFKEKRALATDVTQIAVFQPDRTRQAETVRALTRRGCPAGSVQPHVIPGWSTASTPPAMRTTAGIRQLTAMLAGDEAIEFTSPVLQDTEGGPVILTAHLFVAFNEGVPAAQAEAVLAASGAGDIVDRNFAHMNGVYRLRSTSRNGLDVLAAANALAERADVKFAEVNRIATGRKDIMPDDPLFPTQWGLHNTGQTILCSGTAVGGPDVDIDGPEAWDLVSDSPNVVVAILDDGVQQDHPDINQIPGHDTTDDPLSLHDGGPVRLHDRHGTCVAGIVSARINNGVGVVGVAPQCRIVSIRWNISTSSVFFTHEDSWLAEALAWARSINARVSNSSFWISPASIIARQYDETHAAGMIHCVSAGNTGGVSTQFPASLPSVNAISGIDNDGTLDSGSSYGDVIAFTGPSRGIATTDRTERLGYSSFDYYSCFSGTSAASPYAAGVAALVLCANDSLTAPAVESILKETATDLGHPGHDVYFGWGLPNAQHAIQEAKKASSPADLNGDGLVNSVDLGILLAAWSIPPTAPGCGGAPGPCAADINVDGFVNSVDLGIMLAGWTL